MIHTIHDGHLNEIERADAIKTCHIDPIKGVVGPPLVMRIDPAAGAEMMFSHLRVEAIGHQRLLALQYVDRIRLGRDNNGAAHPAIRASAAAD